MVLHDTSRLPFLVPVTERPVVTPRPQPCAGNPCGPNAVCRVVGTERSCSCLPGYTGQPPQCRPECVRHEECSPRQACLQNKCVDPCPGICGINAECFVVSHNPICSCVTGFTGDPFIRCTPIAPIPATPPPEAPPLPVPVYHEITTLTPIAHYTDYTDQPVIPDRITTSTMRPIGITPAPKDPQDYDPCNPSPCGANTNCKMDYNTGHAVCECKEGYFGNPQAQCGPYCILDTDCNVGFSCISRECRDPCPGACGRNTVCSVTNHRPKCSCADGFTGDPYLDCIVPPIAMTTSEPAFLPHIHKLTQS